MIFNYLTRQMFTCTYVAISRKSLKIVLGDNIYSKNKVELNSTY